MLLRVPGGMRVRTRDRLCQLTVGRRGATTDRLSRRHPRGK